MIALLPSAAIGQSVAAPAPAEAVTVVVGETAMVLAADVATAYVIDGSRVEVAIRNGAVHITGRTAGTTSLVLVSASGVDVRPLLVRAAPARGAAAPARANQVGARTMVQSGFDSQSHRLENQIEMRSPVAGGSRVFAATTVNGVGPLADRHTYLPRITFEQTSGNSRFALFDSAIRDQTMLGPEGAVIRGAHLRFGGLSLHGGYTAPLGLSGIFFADRREAVAGGSFTQPTGGGRVRTTVYFVDGTQALGGARGVLGTLGYDYGSDGGLQVRSELGYGEKHTAAAGSMDARTAVGRIQVNTLSRPLGWVSIGPGQFHGSSGDAEWTASPARRLTFMAAGTWSNPRLPQFAQTTASARAEARVRLTAHVLFTSGLTRQDVSGGGLRSQSIMAPVELAFQSAPFNLAVQYRYRRPLLTDARGTSGGRVSLIASKRGLRFSASVDYQASTPTLDLVFRSAPGLDAALREAGLSVRTPEELAALLRGPDGAGLAMYLEGASLQMSSAVTRANVDVQWTSSHGSALQFRAMADETTSVIGRRRQSFLSLSFSRPLWSGLTVGAGVVAWSRAQGGKMSTSYTAFVRQQFGGVPAPGRRRDIVGVVSCQPRETCPAGVTGIAGVHVRLDGRGDMVTDASGAFVFHGASSGAHRVTAVLPDRSDVYFSTPYEIDVAAGGRADFGLAYLRARLFGAVLSDAGEPVAGVRLVLTGRSRQVATTDSSGKYVFVVQDGHYMLGLDAISLPDGYTLGTNVEQSVHLQAATPTQVDRSLTANRSISGMVANVEGRPTTVCLAEIDRCVSVASDGRYVFRGLAAGTYTVVVKRGDDRRERRVELPAAPSTVRDVDFQMRDSRTH